MSEAVLDFHHDRTYVSAIWYIQGDGKDWLASLTQEPGEPFKFVYRFRIYRDDKAHDSDDIRETACGEYQGSGGEAGALKSIDHVADVLLETGFGREVHKIILRTKDVRVVMDRLSREKWAHIRRINPEDSPST